MTEEEFLAKIISNKSIDTYYIPEKKKHNYWDLPPTKRIKSYSINDFLYEKWRTGGMGGGSCYGGDNYALDGEPEPDILDLDILLMEIVPDISYLKYKMLINGIIEHDSYTMGEFYGNSTVYGTKRIVLKKLYDKMKSLELI